MPLQESFYGFTKIISRNVPEGYIENNLVSVTLENGVFVVKYRKKLSPFKRITDNTNWIFDGGIPVAIIKVGN